MKLERLLLIGAMPLALAFGGCSNINITSNKVNQNGSGNSAVISNTNEQKQEISVNSEDKAIKYGYSYFFRATDAYILSTTRKIKIVRDIDSNELLIAGDLEENNDVRNIEELAGIPDSYNKEIFPNLGNTEGKVAVYYNPTKWKFSRIDGNQAPVMFFEGR